MSKEEALALDGIVSDVLPSAMFRVSLDNGHSVIATLAGKMRRFRIRVLNGDRVTVEVLRNNKRQSVDVVLQAVN